MISTNTEPPKEYLQINQDTKFFNKLLSKETSMANPSFRVYYGVATGAVPFLWETQPGTPKNSIHTPSLPPLTPPPSYHSKLQTNKSNHTKKFHSSKYNTLISTILPRLSLTKSHASSSPSPSLSSSSVSFTSSSSSSLSPSRSHRSRSSSLDGDDDSFNGSPAATGMLRGCYSMALIKNALLSFVGHGSSKGTSSA